MASLKSATERRGAAGSVGAEPDKRVCLGQELKTEVRYSTATNLTALISYSLLPRGVLT